MRRTRLTASVSVTLGTGTGYTIATGKGSAAVAVRDNDEPVVSIAAGSGVTEGADGLLHGLGRARCRPHRST